jgi:hypothetical protein
MSIDNPVRVSDLDMGSGVVPQAEEDALIAIGQRSRAAIAAEEAEAEEDELEEGEELDAEASDSDEEASDDAGADS